jgi:citrate lyase subunit beta/citryl-CoA lyase
MIRSLLYVPAHSERFVGKAHERGADAIVLDLEDSVPPREKAAARAGLPQAASAVARNGATVFVRVNSGNDLIDADAEAACRAGAFGLFVPKVHDPQALGRLADRLTQVEHEIARARGRDAAHARAGARRRGFRHRHGRRTNT